MFVDHLNVIFGEMSIEVLYEFWDCVFFVFWFFLIASFMNGLYILEINPLSVASLANSFSHPEGCLFIFFMVYFAVENI